MGAYARGLLVLAILLAVVLPPGVTPPLSDPTVKFGETASLPCDGSAYRRLPAGQIYFLWQTPTQKVLFFHGGRGRPQAGFEGRAEVSPERAGRADFSLTLRDTSFEDDDQYECIFIRQGEQAFLGKQRLRISGHEELLRARPGGDASFPLRTRAAVQVLFPNSSACDVANGTASCRGPYGGRVSVGGGALTLHGLSGADQGVYVVRDRQGRNITTVLLTVEDVPPSAFWYWILIVIPAVVAVLLLGSRPLLLVRRGAANPLCPGGQDLDTQKPLPPWKRRGAPGGGRPPNSGPQSREEDENRSHTPDPLLGHRAGELDEEDRETLSEGEDRDTLSSILDCSDISKHR